MLTKFRDIKIKEFELPDDFFNIEDNKKRSYILNNESKYKNYISEEKKNLISLINTFWKENNIDELFYTEENNYEDFSIIDKLSEPILFSNKNIFKFSNNNYLFKYPINEFRIRINNKDENILEILLYDFLDKIIIIEKGNIEYIVLFTSSFELKNNYKEIPSECQLLKIRKCHSRCCNISREYEEKYYDY